MDNRCCPWTQGRPRFSLLHASCRLGIYRRRDVGPYGPLLAPVPLGLRLLPAIPPYLADSASYGVPSDRLVHQSSQGSDGVPGEDTHYVQDLGYDGARRAGAQGGGRSVAGDHRLW
jgi:hypothetical protein